MHRSVVRHLLPVRRTLRAPDPAAVYPVEWDLDLDGTERAVVVAWCCSTETAGRVASALMEQDDRRRARDREQLRVIFGGREA